MRTFLLTLGVFLVACSSPEPPATQLEPQQNPGKVEITAEDQTDDNKMEVLVYFRHPLIEGVVAQTRQIFRLKNPADEVKQVIEQLTIPPEPELGIGVWPESSYVRELYLLGNGTVVIDFHEDFVAGLHAGSTAEAFLVYTMVYSVLDSFPKYKKVHILVQGEVQESFLGHVDIEFPIERNHHLYTIEPEVRDQDLIPGEPLPPPDFLKEGLN